MKAIRVEKLGGPEVMKVEDIAPIEEPGPGQAVVRVVAAGVNFADVERARVAREPEDAREANTHGGGGAAGGVKGG